MSEPGEAGNRRGAGELAGEVLGILHAAGEPLSPADVRERLGGDLAYTTVVTILYRLHTKGVLARERAGRAYRYTPVADEPGLAARRMATVLAAEADREAVLARFVSGLSDEDEKALRRMLGDAGGTGLGVSGGTGRLSPAAAAGCARRRARGRWPSRLPPKVATWLLTGAALSLLAALSTAVLGFLALHRRAAHPAGGLAGPPCRRR